MTVEKLKRVMWRLRSKCPDDDRPKWIELKRAIMHECGTDPKTYKHNRKALMELGWVKTYTGKRLKLTGEDLVD